VTFYFILVMVRIWGACGVLLNFVNNILGAPDLGFDMFQMYLLELQQ